MSRPVKYGLTAVLIVLIALSDEGFTGLSGLLLALLLIAYVLLRPAPRKYTFFDGFLLFLGGALLIISLFTWPVLRFIVIFLLLLFLVKYFSNENTNLSHSHTGFINREQWNQRNVKVENLDDFHLVSGTQTCMVDFGQVLIPRGKHSVVIHKLSGPLKIIVPRGVDVTCSVFMFRGEYHSHDEIVTLNNAMHSGLVHGQEASPRQLEIYLYQMWGQVEVVQL